MEQTLRHEECQTPSLMHLFPGSSWTSTQLKQEDKTRRKNILQSINRIQVKHGSKRAWGGGGVMAKGVGFKADLEISQAKDWLIGMFQ